MNKKIILPIIIGAILLGGGAYVLNGESNDKNIQLANKIDSQVNEKDVKKEVNATEVNTNEVGKSQNSGTESEETKKIDEQSDKKETSNSKVEKTENNQNKTSTNTDSKKEQYIKELNNLKNSTDKAITGKIQIEMNMQAEEVYKQWDTELNNIWKELEIKLPKEEMNNLRQKQNEWIKEKEAKKKQTEEESGEVTSASFKVFTVLTEMTKERCYYLVNNYM